MRKRPYILTMLCMLLITACSERIGFEPPKPEPEADMTVHITPDWRQMEKTSRLKAAFYTPSGELFGQYDLQPDGGEVTLLKGEYQVIIYNDDVASVLFHRMQEHGSASAQIVATKAPTQELPSPGILYTSTGKVSEQSLQLAAPISARGTNVTLKVEITGDMIAERITARLHNIADAVNLSTGQAYHTSEDGVNRTPLTDMGDREGFRVFEGAAFGGCQREACDAPDGHKVYADITVDLPDGTQKELAADITEPMQEAQEAVTKIDIEISIEHVMGSLTATVTDWTTGTASGGVTQE